MYRLTILLVISTACLVASLQPRDNVWPHPQSLQLQEQYRLIHSYNFSIVTDSKCDLIISAIKRYHDRFFIEDCHKLDPAFKGKLFFSRQINHAMDPLNRGLLKNLTVKHSGDCPKWPTLDMVERYQLRVDEHGATIQGDSVWGALRGLETFGQLLQHIGREEFAVNFAKIVDHPRFAHRGLLIDSARHYLSMRSIYDTLDAMEMNKLNVLHWHIVDDQSFPIVSETFPELSNKGAFEPNHHIYTKTDVESVLEYARLRGIRVLMEFDSPGHTLAWGKGQKDLLTQCYSNGKPNGELGPIDPTRDSVYPFIEKLFAENARRFPDQYIHLGGDEVKFDCWQSNPAIQTFMAEHGMGTDYAKLESYYMQKLVDIVKGLNKSYIVWQEVFDNGATLKSDTVVHVWLPWGANAGDAWKEELALVTKRGYRVLLSSPWYLDIISYGADWLRYYAVEPLGFNATDAQKRLVIGGEAALWGEYVNGANVIGRTWPRASAVAERLWSSATINSTTKAKPRFYEHTCYMMKQGLRVEPQDGQEGQWCQCDVAL